MADLKEGPNGHSRLTENSMLGFGFRPSATQQDADNHWLRGDTMKDHHTPYFRLSFTQAVVASMIMVVSVAGGGMIIILEWFSGLIQFETARSCRQASETHQLLIDRLVVENVTVEAYRSVLTSMRVSVAHLVKDPGKEAVDDQIGLLRTFQHFQQSSSNPTRWATRQALGQILQNALTVRWAGGRYVTGLYYSPGMGEVIGCRALPSLQDRSIACTGQEAWTGFTTGAALAVPSLLNGVWRDPAAQREEAFMLSFPPELPGSLLMAKWVNRMSVSAADDRGIVAGEIHLAALSSKLHRDLLQLLDLLASPMYAMPTSLENATLFIVSLATGSEGHLLATSQPDILKSGVGSSAAQAPQALIRESASAILQHFGSWTSMELLKSEHFLTFSRGHSSPLIRCDQETGQTCFQIGTLPIHLDKTSEWLAVAALPYNAFTGQATRSSQSTLQNLELARSDSRMRVAHAKSSAVALYCWTLLFSIFFGVALGTCLGKPIQELSAIVQKLSDLDFPPVPKAFLTGMKGSAPAFTITDVQRLYCTLNQLRRSFEAFVRFVPETVVRNIVRGDALATRLHMAKKEVTIMFSDIRDFTSISEALTTRDLLFLLTRYLSVMSHVVECLEGVVAEILGDGLLVYWNATGPVQHHPDKACAAAFTQLRALIKLNVEFCRLGLPELSVRIGIHSGVALTGNIGSDSKMKFGCLGDPVILAGRLEGLCKRYGTNIICSAATFAALKPSTGFVCRRLDMLKVKNHYEPIYQVYGRLSPEAQPTTERQPSRRRRFDGGGNSSDIELGRASPVPSERSLLIGKPTKFGFCPSRWRQFGWAAAEPHGATRGNSRMPSGAAEDANQDQDRELEGFLLKTADNLGLDTHELYHPVAELLQDRAYGQRYERALEVLEEERFEEAIAMLQDLARERPSDMAVGVLSDRARQLLEGRQPNNIFQANSQDLVLLGL